MFVDLPANWTTWSLSLLARADLVLMVTQLSVASLHRARRQLDLLDSQGLGDARHAPGRQPVRKEAVGADFAGRRRPRARPRRPDFTIANDYETITEAIERGVPLAEVRRKGPLARDLATLDAGVAAALELAR